MIICYLILFQTHLQMLKDDFKSKSREALHGIGHKRLNYVTDNQRLFIVSSVLHRIMNEKAKLSSFHYSVSHTRNNKKELIIWLICWTYIWYNSPLKSLTAYFVSMSVFFAFIPCRISFLSAYAQRKASLSIAVQL